MSFYTITNKTNDNSANLSARSSSTTKKKKRVVRPRTSLKEPKDLKMRPNKSKSKPKNKIYR